VHYHNPTVFACPFCPAPTGEVFVDALGCLEQRREDRDPVYLHGDALDGPQYMLRFGYDTDRVGPCEHLLLARGTVRHQPGGSDDEPEEDPEAEVAAEWGIEFDWVPREFRAFDTGYGAVLLGDPERLGGVIAARRPRVRVYGGRCRRSWDALADSRCASSEYAIDAVFVAVSDRAAVRRAFAAELKRFAAVRGRAGG
jgi:hypothetical protein